ncbi:MAG: DNA repair protein RadC [Steroidobacteraceae bacterium]
MSTLYVREGTSYREASFGDVMSRAQGLMAQRYHIGSPALTSPSHTRDYLRVHIGCLEYEVFGCLYLDNRHRVLAIETLFRGTLDGASVHPREVVKAALSRNAAAIIAYHNHPSGVADPSQADELITRRLKEALALVEIRLLDHLIVGETIYSFAETGLL